MRSLKMNEGRSGGAWVDASPWRLGITYERKEEVNVVSIAHLRQPSRRRWQVIRTALICRIRFDLDLANELRLLR
jgi:hypothetical protein